MNVLAALLAENPGPIEESGPGSIAFERLVPLLHENETTSALLEHRETDPLLAQTLHDSFIRVMPEPDWEQQLAEADGWAQAAEWVTFVPGPSGNGAILPQDSTPIERISLFFRVGDSIRRISLEGIRYSPLAVSLSTSVGHCGLPDWGACNPGVCGGCVKRRVEGERRSLVCLCGHER